MRLPTGADGRAVGQRLAGWLFGVREPAATRDRDGRLAGAVFLLTAACVAAGTPGEGSPGQRSAQIALLVALVATGAGCFAVPWRTLPDRVLHLPAAWLTLLLSVGVGTGATGVGTGGCAVGYLLLFGFAGVTTSLLATARLLLVAEAAAVAAAVIGGHPGDLPLLTMTVLLAGVAGHLVAAALSWSRAASRGLARLTRALGELAGAETETEATDRIADLVRELVDADAAMVLLPEHAGAGVYVRRGGYAPTPGGQEFRVDTVTEQCGLGVVVKTASPLFLADAGRSPAESQRLVAALAMASALYLPVPGDGGTAGAVLAWWTSPRHAVDPLGRQLAELAGVPIGQAVARLRHASRLDSPAMRDPLTGVGNRQRFDAALTDLPVGGTLLLFDLDAFAALNDMYGRDAGDEVLRGFADALRRSVRQNDVVTRYADDTFAVVLPANASPIAAGIIIERLQRAWRSPQGCRFSVGVAIRAEAEAPAETLARADADLHTTKRLKVR